VAHMFFCFANHLYMFVICFALVLLPGFVDKEGNLKRRAIVHPPYTILGDG